jgi:hypothetical protein
MPWRNVKKENRDERRLHYIVECSKSLMSRAKKKDAVYAQLSGLVLGKSKKKRSHALQTFYSLFSN